MAAAYVRLDRPGWAGRVPHIQMGRRKLTMCGLEVGTPKILSTSEGRDDLCSGCEVGYLEHHKELP